MQFVGKHARRAVLLLMAAVVIGCGGSGDEYDGFEQEDSSLGTPDLYLRFFNQQQGELDESDFATAYNSAVDPGGARATLSQYIALHGLDNPDVHVISRVTLKSLTFQRRGVDILCTSSAQEGLRVLQTVPNIAVVLLDVVMENDRSGLAACEQIRKSR